MAHIAHPAVSGSSPLRRLRALFDGLRHAYARHRAYGQTFRQLDALSDHELADIGVARPEIPSIARRAADAV
ncbi:DUF1127 domain-containing protein [Celeribacter indicus]|uniref:YjiS-like domain-containing protein n=1 Tax=Celeribacter indicus TaxID=1208324 RepID=A0A0B5DXA6_9RHOB|nr:DUF1127 domain-containing protein [Celeribacter indicus]AJE45386.1 hypothetical protein P73_0671 [Celeribacter indicus]SDX00548.1 protein of unknown function [Celeribacter indicus]